LRGDDGFEDREGHQAPFTLPNAENSHRSTSNLESRIFPARSALWSDPMRRGDSTDST
jgi:hypothetical protein